MILKPVWGAGHTAIMQPLVTRPAQRQQVAYNVVSAIAQFDAVMRGEFRPLATLWAGKAECGAEIEPFGGAEMFREIALVACSPPVSRRNFAGRSPSDVAISSYIFVAFGICLR